MMQETFFLQVAILCLVLFFYSRVVLRLKDGQITPSEFIFWTLLWGSVAVAVFVPSLLSRLSQSVGISRGLDLIVPLGLIVVFYMVFRSYIKLEQLEQDLTKMTREVALQGVKERKKR
jgi:small membrane protein